MRRHFKIHPDFIEFETQLHDVISNFETKGTPFGDQDRNSLKLFDLDEKLLNVKSFRIPNLVNQIAYKFFRKSKAERSFEYANKLIELGVGTPQPIAYYEFTSSLLFNESYYISEQLDSDLTYRELTKDLIYPDHEVILRAFTRFTYDLHEKEVNFLDHSPGNTLIKKVGGGYQFALVDLNRMKFGIMDFEARIKNFARLTIHESMVKIMSNEYAKVSGIDEAKVFRLMWKYTQGFQNYYKRRRRLKKKLKFWKKK